MSVQSTSLKPRFISAPFFGEPQKADADKAEASVLPLSQIQRSAMIPRSEKDSYEVKGPLASRCQLVEKQVPSFAAFQEIERAIEANNFKQTKSILERFPVLAYQVHLFDLATGKPEILELLQTTKNRLDEQLKNMPERLKVFLKPPISVDCSFYGEPQKEWAVARDLLENWTKSGEREDFSNPPKKFRDSAKFDVLTTPFHDQNARERNLLWLILLKKIEQVMKVGFQFNHFRINDVKIEVNPKGAECLIADHSIFSSPSFTPTKPFVLFVNRFFIDEHGKKTGGHVYLMYFDLAHGICEIFDSAATTRAKQSSEFLDKEKAYVFGFVLKTLYAGAKDGLWKLPSSLKKIPTIKAVSVVNRRMQCISSDIFCQTWIFAYIYLRLVLGKSLGEVQHYFNHAINMVESGEDLFATDKLLVQILGEIQEKSAVIPESELRRIYDFVKES